MPGNEPINQSSQDALQSSGQYLRNELAQIIKQAICDVIDSVNISPSEYFDEANRQEHLARILDVSCTKNLEHCRNSQNLQNSFRLVSILPNVGKIVREQCELIRHMGSLYNQKKYLTKEFAAAILLYAIDPVSGGKILKTETNSTIKRGISNELFQKILEQFSHQCLHQLSKSSIVTWLPEVDAKILIGWSNFSTKLIWRKSKEIFEGKIHESEDCVRLDGFENQYEDSTAYEHDIVTVEQIRIFIALMLTDRVKHNNEKSVLLERVHKAPIAHLERNYLLSLIKELGATETFRGDLGLLKLDHYSAIGFLCDMIGLAHCDGNFHPLEKIYIKQIGMDLGIPDSLINDIVDIDGEVAFQRLVQTDNQNKQTTPEALSSANGNPQRDSEAAGYANTVVELNQRIIDQRLEDITNHGIERIHFLPTVRKIMNNECPELIAALNRKYDRNRVNGSRNILAMWYLDLLFGYIAQADMKIPSATSRKYVSNLNDLELWTRPEKRRFQNANQL